jgi:hypothetical protein
MVGILAIKKKNKDIKPFTTMSATSDPLVSSKKSIKHIRFNTIPIIRTGSLLPFGLKTNLKRLQLFGISNAAFLQADFS